jgi:hypothetical protein
MADENWASREWDTLVMATRACKIVAHDALQGFIARPVSATTLIAATVLVNNLTPCSLRWLPSIASLGVLGSIVYGVFTVVPAYASAAATGLQASAAANVSSETFIEKTSKQASEYTACCDGKCCDDFNDDDTCSSSGEDSGGQSGEDCDRASDEERRE